MLADPKAHITVEIAYASTDVQLIIPITLPADITAETAIRASGILEKFPEINLTQNKIGIFGKLARLETTLRHMDRVEIYRPLIADPKEMRKKRADNGKRIK